jgi:hypothetical protein
LRGARQIGGSRFLVFSRLCVFAYNATI